MYFNLLSGVACEECPPEHEEAGEGALRVAQDHPLGLLLQSDPGCVEKIVKWIVTFKL